MPIVPDANVLAAMNAFRIGAGAHDCWLETHFPTERKFVAALVMGEDAFPIYQEWSYTYSDDLQITGVEEVIYPDGTDEDFPPDDFPMELEYDDWRE